MKTQTKKQPAYPFYKVGKNNESNYLWIIAPTASVALQKAQAIWARNKCERIDSVSIQMLGTMDYIPALKKPYTQWPQKQS